MKLDYISGSFTNIENNNVKNEGSDFLIEQRYLMEQLKEVHSKQY